MEYLYAISFRKQRPSVVSLYNIGLFLTFPLTVMAIASTGVLTLATCVVVFVAYKTVYHMFKRKFVSWSS